METAPDILTLARHYLSINQPEKALLTLERGLTDLENWEFWYVRGEALYGLNRNREAEEATRRGLARAPDSIALLLLLANILASEQALAGAETALLAALRNDPENVALLCRYALLLAQGGQLSKAERLLAEANRLDPQETVVVRTRMILLHLRGDDRGALRETRTLLRDNPEDPDDQYTHGTLLLITGQIDRAGNYLNNAARMDPEEDIVAQVRRQRFLAHPLLWPLRPFQHLGRGRAWLLVMATFIGLRLLRMDQIAVAVAAVYIALVVYSWIVVPLLRWWYGRRGYDIEL